MLSDRMLQELNAQLNAELYSAYLYFAMAAYLDAEDMAGFASWMRVQAQEETFHAFKFYTYINERGGRARMAAIEEPPAEWGSPLAAFEQVREHEQKVTGLIHHLVDVAEEEKDHGTRAFLQWFVTEQVEEEASAEQIVRQLELVGDSGNGLLMLDRELGARTFQTPAGEAEAE
ncbi:MAG: ferritin [Candidatus Brocadiaceae bacterium]|jgi:ferritin